MVSSLLGIGSPRPDRGTAVQFHSGDILAFFGTGWESASISVVTGRPKLWYPFWELGPSHVAIIAGLPRDTELHTSRPPKMVLWESTTLCRLPDMLTGERVQGVQVHGIEERIASYNGSVYHLPLVPSWRLAYDEWSVLTRFLAHHKGGHYDYEGAAISGSRVFKFLENRWPDQKSIFCSELCAAGLMRVGRLPVSNSSLFNPANLVRAIQSTGTHSAMVRLSGGDAR